MKPFDLEQAKAGKPIVTRDGRDAKFIAYVPEATESTKLVALIGKDVILFYENGYMFKLGSPQDLFMKTVKKTVYVNIHDYSGRWTIQPGTHYTKEKAEQHAIDCYALKFIAIAVPIEIEE